MKLKEFHDTKKIVLDYKEKKLSQWENISVLHILKEVTAIVFIWRWAMPYPDSICTKR